MAHKHLLRCPDCNKSVEIPKRLLGSTVHCPSCRTTVMLPYSELHSEEASRQTPTKTTSPPTQFQVQGSAIISPEMRARLHEGIERAIIDGNKGDYERALDELQAEALPRLAWEATRATLFLPRDTPRERTFFIVTAIDTIKKQFLPESQSKLRI